MIPFRIPLNCLLALAMEYKTTTNRIAQRLAVNSVVMSRARIMVLSVPSCRPAAASRSEPVLEASLRFRGMHRSPRTE
jgi:hypothetical protein